jgi:hypothetical protein
MPFRVVQWTTGNVGRRSVRAIAANPELELVGCYVWSDEKVGRDAGALAGISDLGVIATNDVDALIALAPDCVSYNPMWPDVDELCRILEAGINVSSTAAFITGHALGDDSRQRIEQACQRGGVSMFGSGMNPGFANLLGLVSAGICDRIDKISVLESVDSTGYASPETELPIGFAQPITNPELPDMVRRGTAVFGDAARMMADALHVEVDDVVCESNFAVAEPDWELEHGYLVEIEGQPCVKTKLEIRPPHDFEAKSFEDFMQLGMIITSLPAVNAIPAVCAAPAGIRSYADLPLITGAGFLRT